MIGLVNNHGIAIATQKADKGGVKYNLHYQKARNWTKVAKKDSKDVKKTGNPAQVYSFATEHLPVNTLQTASKVLQ